MADETIDNRFTYVPGKTLGRSGSVEGPDDRLATRARQLDALLCVISCSSHADADEEASFLNLNQEIQRATLDLASSLATEIHELHEEASLLDAKQRSQTRQQSQPQH